MIRTSTPTPLSTPMSDPSRTILFPGSFDPFTRGHKSIVDRALPLADRLIIAIGHNPAKQGWLTVEQRVEAIQAIYAGDDRVEVTTYTGLTVDACRRHGAGTMLRGVRTVADFEYERALADVNRTISGIDTLLLFTLPEDASVSSSMVRELASHGHDITPFLP